MRRFLLVLGALALICSPAMAGKNAGGAMVVHTDDAHGWTNGLCTLFDEWYPGITCPDLGLRTDVDVNTPALIWFLAAFLDGSSPGVTVCYFGHDHNMPQYYHNRWGFCGPAGTIEVPDTGWPDTPATAGNSVAFGSPIAGDILFPFYYFDVWGETGWYYCTAINPVGGYAGYVDDSNPPVLDEIECFGCVYYGTDSGYNECPPCGVPMGACCYEDGSCTMEENLDNCLAAGGYDWLGEGTVCDPNPCPPPPPPTGACCYEDGSCIPDYEEIPCYESGGILWLEDLTCDPNPCPPPITGACCYPDGSCLEQTANDCTGDYYGDYVPCDPNPCPQLGACCAPDGSCTVTLQPDCPYDLWIEGEVCAPNPCPQLGACCDEFTGACYVSTEAECYEELWIEGEVCEPNPCPPPPDGACCYGCEECIVLPQYLCEDLPDDYAWYEGEVCEPNPCPPIATETTTWGSIKADYK